LKQKCSPEITQEEGHKVSRVSEVQRSEAAREEKRRREKEIGRRVGRCEGRAEIDLGHLARF